MLGCNVCTLVPILGQRRGQILTAKKIDFLVSYSALGDGPWLVSPLGGSTASSNFTAWISIYYFDTKGVAPSIAALDSHGDAK